MKTGTIYMLKCLITGKAYIGKDSNYPSRPAEHLSTKKTGCKAIYAAVKKHGAKAFIYGVIEDNIPIELLNKRERYWIEKYHTYGKGYNLTEGGDGAMVGELHPMKRSDIAKKVSESRKGIPRSDETKRKISEAKKGRKHTPQHCKNISKSLRLRSKHKKPSDADSKKKYTPICCKKKIKCKSQRKRHTLYPLTYDLLGRKI